MKILNTIETNTGLIELLNNSNDFLILICPFINLQTQYENLFIKAINKISYSYIITRPDNDKRDFRNNLDFLKKINSDKLSVGKLNTLHAKIYLNEKGCLITSMNLIDSTKNKNYEIGLSLEKDIYPEQYQEILNIAIEIIKESTAENTDDLDILTTSVTMGKLYADFIQKHNERIQNKFKNKTEFYDRLCQHAKTLKNFEVSEHYKGSTITLLRTTKINYNVYKNIMSNFLKN